MVLFFAILGVIFAQSASPEGVGVIRDLSGTVELKLAGSSDFIAASAGDVIAQSTIVSTGFKSSAVIVMGSSVISVRPLTRLSFAEIQSSSGAETVNVGLQTGRVRVDVNPPAGTRANVTVKSPSATASVRGTSFEFDTVNLTVNEGTVAFSGNFGPAAMVNAGGTSFVGSNVTPADPANLITADLMPSAPVGTGSTVTQTPSPSSSGELLSSGELGVTIEY